MIILQNFLIVEGEVAKLKEILLPLLPVIALGGVIIFLAQGKVPFEKQLGLDRKQVTKAQPGEELQKLLKINTLGERRVTATPTPLKMITAPISCCSAWEKCGGTDYGWGQEGCSFYQRACSWCGQTPIITPTPTPTTYYVQATPTPTPTSTPSLACLSVGVYANPADTTPVNHSFLNSGDLVYLTAEANPAGNPTQARFKINGGNWQLTTNQINQRFYVPFTIPGQGVFQVEAMIYYQADNQWH